jgi:hypothetical protein
MLGKVIPTIPQLDAAKALVRVETGSAATGKRAKAVDDAGKAAAGRFGAATAPPKLVVNNK